MLFLINIKDEIQACNLPKDETSLPKYLSTQGYKTTLATTISYNKNDVNWEKVKNVYPFEDFMLYNDFNYKGKSVPIFSDRYTIPDEYTLNYAYQSALNKSPFFLSVNTTNSHYNYISPIKPIKHWKDYNSIDFSLTDGLKKNSLKNFFNLSWVLLVTCVVVCTINLFNASLKAPWKLGNVEYSTL